MKSLLHAILSGLMNYWFEASVSIVLVLSGWLGGFFRARNRWKRREFLEQINISFNMLHEGKLLLRTLAERPLEHVFTNAAALSALQQACNLTTETNPVPPLAKEDFWPILNCVLNVLSEQFSTGYIRRDLGYPVKSAAYLICLTRERAAAMRTNKIRALVIKKETLLNLPVQEPQYEHPTHNIRFKTLQQLAALYRSDPGQFVEIELSL
jgi:hypothetical protein